MRRRFRRYLVYVGLRMLMIWARLTPRRPGIRILGTLGSFAYRVLGRERRIALQNLSQAFPELSSESIERLAVASFRNLGRNFFDVLRFRYLTAEDIDSITSVQGIELFLREEEKGKGCIGLMGHIGCWEMVGAMLVARGYRTNAVARPIRNPRIERLLLESRERVGVRVVPRGPRIVEAYKALRRGELVGILIDQDTEVEGHFVPFFGRPAHTPVGLAHLALRSGASILPVASYLRDDLTHEVRFGAPIPYDDLGKGEDAAKRLTERCGEAIEAMIRRDPSQWVWFHRRWKTRPVGDAGLKEEIEAAAATSGG